MVLNGQSSHTTYNYDAANQLITAEKDATTWYYSYDGNGNLIESSPSEMAVNGTKRYSYNAANFLIKVEAHNSIDWFTQAEMRYDGMGNRLEMTAYAEGQSVTTEYIFDGGRTLSADSDGNSTFYLHGAGLIGEFSTNRMRFLPSIMDVFPPQTS